MGLQHQKVRRWHRSLSPKPSQSLSPCLTGMSRLVSAQVIKGWLRKPRELSPTASSGSCYQEEDLGPAIKQERSHRPEVYRKEARDWYLPGPSSRAKCSLSCHLLGKKGLGVTWLDPWASIIVSVGFRMGADLEVFCQPFPCKFIQMAFLSVGSPSCSQHPPAAPLWLSHQHLVPAAPCLVASLRTLMGCTPLFPLEFPCLI